MKSLEREKELTFVESDPNTSIECGWDKETWKSI